MRTWDEVQTWFTLGWDESPDSFQKEEIKTGFHEMARTIWHYAPNGPEKTLTLRRLWDASILAAASFVLEGGKEDE